MSRLGKLPIELKKGIEVKIDGDFVVVKGPKGELRQKTHPLVKIDITPEVISIGVADKEDKKQKALWGLFRSLINNMVAGVSDGFSKKLEINGVGYKVNLSGNKLVFALGYSHPINFVLPAGISAAVEGNVITLTGADKQLVGETAANIRKLRGPEPYKGKGVKYMDEVIRRKEGKAAAKAK